MRLVFKTSIFLGREIEEFLHTHPDIQEAQVGNKCPKEREFREVSQYIVFWAGFIFQSRCSNSESICSNLSYPLEEEKKYPPPMKWKNFDYYNADTRYSLYVMNNM